MAPLAFLSDIHGAFGVLEAAEREAVAQGACCLIQVGDFGWHLSRLGPLRTRRSLPVYFIDGNHDDHADLFARLGDRDVVELWDSNLFYVRRGTVLTLGGYRVAFLGGAASIDQGRRLKTGDFWSPLEQITDADIARFDGVDQVDLLVTHTPPRRIIRRHYSSAQHLLYIEREFGVSKDWYDPSADKVDALWDRLGQPPLFCGHMHEPLSDGNVRQLGFCHFAIYPDALALAPPSDWRTAA